MADVAYLALADRLQHSLTTAAPGTRLPSEHELADRHGVSRITTRAALQELERRHLVVRRRGAGTFAALRIEYPISTDIAPSFTETIRRAGHVPRSEVLSVRRVRPPARVRDRLHLGTDDEVVRLHRLSYVDEQRTGIHTSWIAHVDVDVVRSGVRDGDSLYAVLTDAGFDIHRDAYVAEQDTIPARAATSLGLEGRPQAWHTFSTNRCHRRDLLVEANESWVRADVIRVRFELGASTAAATTTTTGSPSGVTDPDRDPDEETP